MTSLFRLTVALVLSCHLLLACGGDSGQGIGSSSTSSESDWQAWVMAPSGPVVYPVNATWQDPQGNRTPVDPQDLQGGSKSLLLG